jgi:hypothetical protein
MWGNFWASYNGCSSLEEVIWSVMVEQSIACKRGKSFTEGSSLAIFSHGFEPIT